MKSVLYDEGSFLWESTNPTALLHPQVPAL